ncbi:ligand-gated ion channel 4-like [Saccostrea echinata]|uniref:ligand-gated ion channel 4-like n=1 Tax=Saccostrea echinata TaxID=191078 RepID=UPI002A81960E|nr:ligand-gated ion channel 4-like [Saccostrea echinata]
MTLWDPILLSKSKLRKDLLLNYTKELPPNDTQTIVYISFSAFDTTNIIDFDEEDGKFSVSGYLEVSWIDPRVAMNWASSPGFQTEDFPLYLKDSEVWTPLIRQINAYSRSDFENMVEETVMFHRDGSALMVKMDIFTTECKTNYRYFPFDTQECSIDMVIWGSFMGETILKAHNSTINKALYKKTYNWNLEDASISVDSIDGFRNKRTSEVQRARIKFKIKRNSTYYVCFLILPFIILQSLQPFVFLMPRDCGERASFSVTVLLSIAVYLTIVVDHIPKTPESDISLLGIKMVIDVFTGACFQVFVILRHRFNNKICRSKVELCKVSKDSENTSPSPENDTGKGETTDLKDFCLTLFMVGISHTYTIWIYLSSEV